jgi:hypothetical protein
LAHHVGSTAPVLSIIGSIANERTATSHEQRREKAAMTLKHPSLDSQAETCDWASRMCFLRSSR